MHVLAFIAMLAVHVGLIVIFARAMAPTVWRSDASPYTEE